MKIYLCFFMILFCALISMLIGCRPQAKNEDKVGANEIEQTARSYLQPKLSNGESTTNIIAKFGKPFYQYETKSGELCMYFRFDEENKAALAAGVGGFTGFFTNNHLSHWVPIYR